MEKANKETYRIISKGGVGEFSVLDAAGDHVTVFSYKGWFSSTGSASTERGRITIKSKDDWQTSFIIQRSRKHIGDIVFNWRGNIVIALKDSHDTVCQFLLEDLGHSKWLLKDAKSHVVLSMQLQSHWSKKSNEYQVELKRKPSVYVDELLIACGYATNLNNSKVASLKG
jgi:hypothetical protein